ncbi:hypothetical protein EF919_38485 [Streptomyces sp. WAC02707]|uniref:hypothetical protein n=1 Tax=Streptomyces sp. WAC02707 TaxID=2487417 RepID=UPI000F7A6AEE|nr:hypothetical protein [Streptomyces sp. WAC02707]RSS84758.1 hypothetical protein EF919_38485 [Streptomyces sp. WAC02707]
MARLAAATGSEAAGQADGRDGGVLTVDLDGDMVMVAAVDTLVRGAVRGVRATSTPAAAELQRKLAPWTAALDQELLPGAQLWVEDHGNDFSVRLLVSAAGEGELDRVAAAAGAGLARVRTWRADSGLDGRGSLPCGRTVHLAVVCLS